MLCGTDPVSTVRSMAENDPELDPYVCGLSNKSCMIQQCRTDVLCKCNWNNLLF
jgi:hypothetical protein